MVTKRARATPESGAGRDDSLSNLPDRASGSQGSLPNEANDIESASKDIGQNGSLGRVGFAEPRGVFHPATRLASVATFGVALASQTQFPRRRADLQITSQANVSIGECEGDDDHTSQGVFWVLVRASRRGIDAL